MGHPASETGSRTFLSGAQDGCCFSHEMDTAENDHLGIGLRGFDGKLQGVAAKISNILHLGPLVVVGQQNCLSIMKQGPNFFPKILQFICDTCCRRHIPFTPVIEF